MAKVGFRGVLGVVTAVAFLLFAPLASGAALCDEGAGPGQCKEPRGMASDWETGLLYLADRGNNRIEVFDTADESFVDSFGETLRRPTSVAVDNDELSAFQHDVYAVDFPLSAEAAQRKIVMFEPNGTEAGSCGEGEFASSSDVLVATGPGGELYAADERSVSGTPTLRVRRYEPGCGAKVFEADVATGDLKGLAVDSEGNFYLRGFTPQETFCKYDEDGAKVAGFLEAGCFPFEERVGVLALSVDEEDHLFAVGLDRDGDGTAYRVIAEYSPSGEAVRRFLYRKATEFVNGLAVAPGGEGPAYAAIGDEVLIVPFAAGPEIVTREAEGVSSAQATLSAEVNPEGEATEYHFEYLTEAEYQGQGESFVGPDTQSTPVEPLGAEDVRLHRAEAGIGCIDPESEPEACLLSETEYRWRIVASNPGGETIAEGTPFETGILEILDEWPATVGVDSAALHVEANPFGSPSTAFFEYITEAAYEANLAAARPGFQGASKTPDIEAGQDPIELGAGIEPVTRSTVATGLQPHTAYRFRAVATNPFLPEAEPQVIGKGRSFTTLARVSPLTCAAEGLREGLVGARIGAGAFLPDCRAYELVSPLEKNNADIVYSGSFSGVPISLEQSSTDGERMAYTAQVAFSDPEGAPYVSQYVAGRVADADGEWDAEDGWQTHDVSSKRDRLIAKGAAQFDTEFEAFSPDLCQAWLRTVSDPPLAEGGVKDKINLYRRQDEECGGSAYSPITTIVPPNVSGGQYALFFQGASADGERAIYRANDTLPGTGAADQPVACTTEPTKCESRLYSQSAGEGTRSVCFLPGGAEAGSCGAGTTEAVGLLTAQRFRNSQIENAISDDGSRVFWSTPAPGEGKIFMRDLAAEETVAVSAPGEALSGTTKSRYVCAAADGSRAIYTSGGDLYEFHPDEGEGLTHEVAGEAVGVAGCSQDATVVYLGTREALTGPNVEAENSEGDEAIGGEVNLYRYAAAATPGDPGGYEFVASLAQIDVAHPSGLGPLAAQTNLRLARVTPDGGALAFMSAAGPASQASEGVPAPTGFDNTDAVHDNPDMETYLHRAGSGELSCASCSPGGARPVGVNINPAGDEKINTLWAAGWIPPWQNPLYAGRPLSDSGARLFFESVERLVARDTNGRQDVYQWEAPGEGTCTTASSAYSPRNEGCVQLISSGQAAGDADFRDASPSGQDVFFATPASLVPQDYGLIDIYDARVGGGLPVPPPADPVCEGSACQSPPPAPQAPTPASSAYRGPGDVSPATARCARPARRASRLSRAAKRLRRASAPRAKRRMARRAARVTRRARTQSRAAKRCRARARRAARRAER